MTEYVYCPLCFAAAKKWLLDTNKGLCSQVIRSWDGSELDKLPIIAGKLGGSYSGEEAHAMELLLNDLGTDLCYGHSIRVVVVPNSAAPVLLTARARQTEVTTTKVNDV